MLCPGFRKNGFCGIKNCPHTHPTWSCELCGVFCRSKEYLEHHLASRTHALALRASSGGQTHTLHKCVICKVRMHGNESVQNHLHGKTHRVRLISLKREGHSVDEANVIVNENDASFKCLVCEISIRVEKKAQHERSPRHTRKERFLKVRAALEEASKNKHGVLVYPSGIGAFDFGLMEKGKAVREFIISVEAQHTGLWLHSAIITGEAHHSWRDII